MAGIPGSGDAASLGCGDNDCMATGWTQRIAAAPHSLTTVGVVLGLAAFGQAIARAVMLATAHTVQAASAGTAADAALYAVPLCLLALATTVPLIFLRPAAAAVAITAASTVTLTVFGSGALTVGGLAAQVLASYHLGRAGVPGGAGARWDHTQIRPVAWPCPSSCSRSPATPTFRPSCWPCLSRRRPGPESPTGHAAMLRGRPPPVR